MLRAMWVAMAAGFVLALTPSSAEAQDATPFLGTYETKGRYSNWRKTKADIEVKKGEDGKIVITRTGKYTSRRHRRKPAFTWVSNAIKVEGDRLKVTYRITNKGVSLTLADGGNLVDALTGEDAPSTGEDAVDPDEVNVLEAEYWFEGDDLKEQIKNTTRKKPEHWWRKVGTKGKKESSPDPVDPQVKRIKLGGELEVQNGKVDVIIPTDGTLTLEIDQGSIKLHDPSGGVAAVSSGNTLTFDQGHETPVLGTYTAEIEGVTGNAKLKAKFVQLGKIDARIRPWSSHTYYPIYEKSWGDSENENTLFKKDGPLEKFDKALELTGRESSIWWEKGGDYRTGFGFEHGHYTKIQSPTEKKAEAEWYADLNGDGVIETGDAEEVVKRHDADGDGKVSEDEAKKSFQTGVAKSLFNRYDEDGDGKVSDGEISAAFIARYDADSNKDLSLEEWTAGLKKDYASLLEDRSKDSVATFMKKDADADGFVVKDEVGAPGAVDFQDSSDVDGDFDSFFDRNNIKITTNDDKVHFGNKVTEENGKLKLFKGRKSDELVVELDPADVKERLDGIADGDLDDSYSVGWWGHCNAWAMASIVFRKPEGDLELNGVTFSVRDQKGLLVEFGMGDTEDSTFWWQQWGGDDIPPDKYAAGFHRQMHRWLRVEQKGMMADMDLKDPHNNLNFQVWNYPLLGYEAELKEAEGDDPWVLDVSCKIEKGSYSDEDSSGFSTVKYRLHFAQDGDIKTGEESKTSWEQKNSSDKLEFIRYLIHPFRFSAARGTRNPNVSLDRLQKLFGEKLKYNRIEDLENEPEPEGLDGTPGD